jgi:hypothetical protein
MEYLPDELVLHILSYYHAIRSYEPQSQAFKEKAKEKDRQRENHLRRKALCAVSLTSQRLKRVAEPILYSAFVGSLTWMGVRSLCLFHRTLTERPVLAPCIQYIEIRLSDYLGNGLYDDLELYGAVDMVTEYFNTLASIIGRSVNLVHLSVVSIETSDVSLWRHLVKTENHTPRMAMHGYSKLRTLCLQIHTGEYGLDEGWACFRRITNALLTVPTLEHILASGVTSGCMDHVPGNFTSLTTIDISECILELDDVIHMVSACNHLKRFGCHWAYLRSRGFHLPNLYAALLAHKNSLEYFHLDAREVQRPIDEDDDRFEALDSLREFDELKSVEVCEGSLLSTPISLIDFPDQRLPMNIAELLPESLESLTLLLSPEYGYPDDFRIDDSFALWDLADECPGMLPNLKRVRIKSEYLTRAVNLPSYFRNFGVELSSVSEPRLCHC